jgi:hypothetical protein
MMYLIVALTIAFGVGAAWLNLFDRPGKDRGFPASRGKK